jgi:hypothetical protein
MDGLWAMSLPGLVVILVVAGVVDVAVTRRRRRRGDAGAKAHVAEVGFDALGLALAPSRRHKKEHDEFMELRREEEGDGAPPRSMVDLDSGRARIVVPPHAPQQARADASGAQDRSTS